MPTVTGISSMQWKAWFDCSTISRCMLVRIYSPEVFLFLVSSCIYTRRKGIR